MIGSGTPRFWRYFTAIALFHVLVVIALVRSSHGLKNIQTESVVWLNSGGAGDGDHASSIEKIPSPAPEPKQLQTDEPEEDRTRLASAKSEIQLPSQTPKASPVPRVTPEPSPKPSKRKTVPVKATKPPIKKAKELANKKKDVDSENKRLTKKRKATDEKPRKTIAAHGGVGKDSSPGAGGKSGGAGKAAQFGWYGSMLHDRFHSAWIQPISETPAGKSVSVLVKVRIEQDGNVSQFEIVRPSGNTVVDESVSAVAKRVTQVDPLPNGLGTGGHYDVRINFELNAD